MLDRQTHEFHLKNILRNIANESQSALQLALKGGTCLYLFYELPRFSVDLDFDLIVDEKKFDKSILDNIFKENLQIEDYFEKRWTFFWLLSFKKGRQKIKIEINKRKFDNRYTTQQFYGLSIITLDQASLFAHKLCAIADRDKIANRDLFDAWFMFKKEFPIRGEIIQERMGLSLLDYFNQLLEFIPKNVNETRLLHGLGELLDKKQKQWVKEKLLPELLFQIQIRLESTRKKPSKQVPA